MRRILLAVILIIPLFGFLLPVLSPVHGFTAYTLVASTIKQSSNTLDVTTDATDFTTADLIIIGDVHHNGAGSLSVAITDSQSNIYTCETLYTSSGGAADICYIHNPSVSSSHTVTSTCIGGICFPALVVEAWRYSSASPADQNNGNGSVSGASPQTFGAITPIQDNELLISLVTNIRTEDYTVNSGYNIRAQAQLISGIAYGIALADKVQTSATTEDPGWSLPISSFFQISGTNASFKFTAPAASGNKNLMIMGMQ